MTTAKTAPHLIRPQDMLPRGTTVGCAQRTLANLDFIVRAYARGEPVRVVTQAVSSMLGLVVHPYERVSKSYREGLELRELESQLMPFWLQDADKPAGTLFSLVKNLRHALGHGH